jgi:hypothetical protein
MVGLWPAGPKIGAIESRRVGRGVDLRLFSHCQVARAMESDSSSTVLLPEGFWCVTYRPSGTLDRLRKLDMVQHYKWILVAYGLGCDGLGGKGCQCTRMRPKLHLPVWGRAFRVTGVLA